MFRGGIDRKLVKEVIGHQSNTVDAYQVTDHEQRKKIREVIQGIPSVPSEVKGSESGRKSCKSHVNEEPNSSEYAKGVACTCKSKEVSESANSVRIT